MIINIDRKAYKNELIEYLTNENVEFFNIGERVLYVPSDECKEKMISHFISPLEFINNSNIPYPLVSKEYHEGEFFVEVNGVKIGGNNPVVIMAGPCAVESKEQVEEIAKSIKFDNVKVLRGGAFKPRTSPYAFQGLGEEGLKMLQEAGHNNGLAVVTEIMDASDLPMFEKYADIIQVGARNMQNFSLLKALGKSTKPILLKRGMSATVLEWLLAAEYIVSHGNQNVILCERGIRTFGSDTRNTLDLSSVAVVKKLSYLPVIVDPSHATGRYDLVEDLSFAAVAAGADGLLLECHTHPECALCDGDESIKVSRLENISKKIKLIEKVVR